MRLFITLMAVLGVVVLVGTALVLLALSGLWDAHPAVALFLAIVSGYFVGHDAWWRLRP